VASDITIYSYKITGGIEIMKYAIINGEKEEAFKGGTGYCPYCNSELIARCGDVKINHWAHKGARNCDKWWENETEWHRQWKNKFPREWQEIVHFDETGEKHIADVKTTKNWIIEFQHSFIKNEERKARNNFYSKIVWVIDGLRRKTDRTQFIKSLQQGKSIPFGNKNIFMLNFPEESRLLKEWHNCGTPVFFDFSEINESPLWFLLPINIKDKAYIVPFSREEFIKTLNNDGFDELCYKIIPEIEQILVKNRKIISRNNSYRPRPIRSRKRL